MTADCLRHKPHPGLSEMVKVTQVRGGGGVLWLWLWLNIHAAAGVNRTCHMMIGYCFFTDMLGKQMEAAVCSLPCSAQPMVVFGLPPSVDTPATPSIPNKQSEGAIPASDMRPPPPLLPVALFCLLHLRPKPKRDPLSDNCNASAFQNKPELPSAEIFSFLPPTLIFRRTSLFEEDSNFLMSHFLHACHSWPLVGCWARKHPTSAQTI